MVVNAVDGCLQVSRTHDVSGGIDGNRRCIHHFAGDGARDAAVAVERGIERAVGVQPHDRCPCIADLPDDDHLAIGLDRDTLGESGGINRAPPVPVEGVIERTIPVQSRDRELWTLNIALKAIGRADDDDLFVGGKRDGGGLRPAAEGDNRAAAVAERGVEAAIRMVAGHAECNIGRVHVGGDRAGHHVPPVGLDDDDVPSCRQHVFGSRLHVVDGRHNYVVC